jgi:hypothetical protein
MRQFFFQQHKTLITPYSMVAGLTPDTVVRTIKRSGMQQEAGEAEELPAKTSHSVMGQ